MTKLSVTETVRMAIASFEEKTGRKPKRVLWSSADKREALAEYRALVCRSRTPVTLTQQDVDASSQSGMEFVTLRQMKPGMIIVDDGPVLS